MERYRVRTDLGSMVSIGGRLIQAGYDLGHGVDKLQTCTALSKAVRERRGRGGGRVNAESHGMYGGKARIAWRNHVARIVIDIEHAITYLFIIRSSFIFYPET